MASKIMFHGETWTDDAFRFFDNRRLNGAISRLRRFERKKGIRFDAIVGCGISGLIPATLLCDRLHLPLLAIRKKTDKGPNWESKLAGVIPDNVSLTQRVNYLGVDDLISSGTTMTHVINHINSVDGDVVAIMLYAQGEFIHHLDYAGVPIIVLSGCNQYSISDSEE